jgi:hypothetical protein
MRYNSEYERERETGHDPRYGGRRESGGQFEEDFDREYQERFSGRGSEAGGGQGRGRSSRPNGPWQSGSQGGGRSDFDTYEGGSQFGSPWSNSGGDRGRSQYGSFGYGPNNPGSGNFGLRGFGGSQGYDSGQYGGGSYGSSTYGSGSYGQGRQSGQGGQGQFAGKGPKGYKRNDQRVIEDISERLSDHPQIDASEIEIRLEEGVAVLTGTVSDRQSKRLAEEIAESVSGVQDVRNELRLQNGSNQESDQQNRSMRKDSQSETGKSEMTSTAKRG